MAKKPSTKPSVKPPAPKPPVANYRGKGDGRSSHVTANTSIHNRPLAKATHADADRPPAPPKPPAPHGWGRRR